MRLRDEVNDGLLLMFQEERYKELSKLSKQDSRLSGRILKSRYVVL